MNCDQCEASRINGVFCHEQGCPNARRKWVNGQWIRFHKCPECGQDVNEGDSCCLLDD